MIDASARIPNCLSKAKTGVLIHVQNQQYTTQINIPVFVKRPTLTAITIMIALAQMMSIISSHLTVVFHHVLKIQATILIFNLVIVKHH